MDGKIHKWAFMAKSIKENYIFSLINTISGILFPLITFPYASRIMEADGMGQIGFFTSIITYVSLFTSLGIPIYAIREIAKVRDDAEQMSLTTIEILLLHTLLVIIGYIAIAVMCMTVSKIAVDIPLFLILSASVFFTAIGCEWFYQGIEEFKYIALRGLFVRIIYVILLFSLVHTKEDILIYAGLTILGTVGNNVFNFCRLWRYVKIKFVTYKKIRISKHILPAFKIFALNLVISLYVNLDTVMLGFLKNNYAVGYYDGASKIARLILALIQALQTAMIPRFSYLAKEGDLTKFHQLAQKVFDYIVTISLPITIALGVLSPSLIHFFCGPSYEPAIITLEIMSPIVFMISLSGIAGLQILYPLGKESLVIWSTITGAIVNLIMCFLLIPSYSANGAAIAVLMGETSVTVSMFIYGRRYIKIERMSKHYLNCIIGTLLLFVFILLIRLAGLNDWINIFLIPLVGIIVYSIILYIMRDEFFSYLFTLICTKVVKFRG